MNRMLAKKLSTHNWLMPFLALLLGSLHVLSFAPFGLWFIQFLSLGGLFYLWQHSPKKNADSTQKISRWQSSTLIGLAFGLGWFGVGIHWTFFALANHTDLPFILCIISSIGFSTLLALFPMLSGYLWRKFRHYAPQHTHSLVFASCVVLGEWLRSVLLHGFPWLNNGYAHTDGLFAGFAPIANYMGISWLISFCAALLVFTLQQFTASKKQAAYAALFGLILILSTGSGLSYIQWSQPIGKPLTVALLQANIPQNIKFLPEQQHGSLDVFEKLAKNTTQTPPDLIIMPETGVPDFWQNLAYTNPSYLERLQSLTNHSKHGVITGIPFAWLDNPNDNTSVRLSNSAILFDQHSDMRNNKFIARYDKRHLVPFGEFMPWGFEWITEKMNIALGTFSPGEPQQANIQIKDQRLGIMICYEDLFIAEVYTALPSATILVNLSNLGWYDDSIALAQHLQISRMRSLEVARPILRATNTGVTAIIDERGKVTAQLPIVTTDKLVGTVQGQEGLTPIAWLHTHTGRFGIETLTGVFCLLGLLPCLRRNHKKGQVNETC